MKKKSGIDRSIEAFITIHTCTQAYIEMLLYVYIKQNETEENIQNIFSLGYLLVNSFPIVYMNLIVSLLVVNKGKHSSNYVAVELVIITIFFSLFVLKKKSLFDFYFQDCQNHWQTCRTLNITRRLAVLRQWQNRYVLQCSVVTAMTTVQVGHVLYSSEDNNQDKKRRRKKRRKRFFFFFKVEKK